MRGETAAATIHRVDSTLSEDQRRVLDLLAVGLPIMDVALLLRMSEVLVRRHFAALLHHYGAEDRTTLVIAARRAGQRPGLVRLARGVAETGPLPVCREDAIISRGVNLR